MAADLRVGIVGAGEWAAQVYGPIFDRGEGTRVSAAWSRTPGRAAAVGPEVADLDALIAASDAVVIAVAPDAQPDIAVRCLEAGRPTMLEKPLALDLDGARRITDAAARTGTPTQLMLTYRYGRPVREFLAGLAARDAPPTWGHAEFVTGVMLRLESGGWRAGTPDGGGGAVYDLGPHLLDLVVASMGPLDGDGVVAARGDRHGATCLTAHAGGGGCVSVLDGWAPVEPSRTELEVGGPGWVARCDARGGDRDELFETMRREFAQTARSGRSHALDAAHGLALQETVAAVAAAIGAR